MIRQAFANHTLDLGYFHTGALPGKHAASSAFVASESECAEFDRQGQPDLSTKRSQVRVGMGVDKEVGESLTLEYRNVVGFAERLVWGSPTLYQDNISSTTVSHLV